MDNLRRENTRVHRVCGKLQSSQHALGMRLSELQDKLHLAEENSAEWKNKYEDLVYKHEKACEKTCKLERRLAEAQAASREYNEKVSYRFSNIRSHFLYLKYLLFVLFNESFLYAERKHNISLHAINCIYILCF